MTPKDISSNGMLATDKVVECFHVRSQCAMGRFQSRYSDGLTYDAANNFGIMSAIFPSEINATSLATRESERVA